MSASTASTAKPFLSGFCNPANPPSSHVRCRVVCDERPCVCLCHVAEQELRAALVVLVESAGAVRAVLAGSLAVWLPVEVRRSAERLLVELGDLVGGASS